MEACRQGSLLYCRHSRHVVFAIDSLRVARPIASWMVAWIRDIASHQYAKTARKVADAVRFLWFMVASLLP